jgi:integrase
VNHELGTLQQILKSRGFWGPISDQVKMLRERHDIGRAISRADEEKLLTAARESLSPSLYPLFVLSIDSGLRASEVRSLRRCDLKLTWRDGLIVEGELAVPNSKTEFGTGRMVPLSRRACDALSMWLSRFPDAGPDAFVFPFHRVKAGPKRTGPVLWDVELDRPTSEWKSAWQTARTRAKLNYRWHDLRHSFVSRLAENPHVSEETIRALAGHVSRRMLERYSHIRTHAKRAAILGLEHVESQATERDSDREGAQKMAQSDAVDPRALS